MPAVIIFMAICLLFPVADLYPESFRTIMEGVVEVSPDRPAEEPIILGINSSVLINLGAEARFLRGIELEITAPQAWLRYRGSLSMMMYNNLIPQTAENSADFDGSRIVSELLPTRLRIIYHIPVRQAHGLRTTTSVSVPTGVVQRDTFPILFRLSAADKGLTAEFENMTFNFVARPILSDEGAVRLIPRYPAQLRGRPVTVLIDDNVISNINEQVMLREGEHHLVVLSEDYRNESRRFVVERARVTDLIIELQDPAPVIIFEGPQNAEIFLNNIHVTGNREHITVEPGQYEVRFQIGDYTIIRTMNIQRGKTYRISLEVDLTIHEEE